MNIFVESTMIKRPKPGSYTKSIINIHLVPSKNEILIKICLLLHILHFN